MLKENYPFKPLLRAKSRKFLKRQQSRKSRRSVSRRKRRRATKGSVNQADLKKILHQSLDKENCSPRFSVGQNSKKRHLKTIGGNPKADYTFAVQSPAPNFESVPGEENSLERYGEYRSRKSNGFGYQPTLQQLMQKFSYMR